MIKVIVTRKNDKITSLEVSGHANYEVKGKDIVCAGVSAIVVGGFNALAKCNPNLDIVVTDKVSKVKITDVNDNNIQSILNTMYIQLDTIYQSYPKNISIKEV